MGMDGPGGSGSDAAGFVVQFFEPVYGIWTHLEYPGSLTDWMGQRIIRNPLPQIFGKYAHVSLLGGMNGPINNKPLKLKPTIEL